MSFADHVYAFYFRKIKTHQSYRVLLDYSIKESSTNCYNFVWLLPGVIVQCEAYLERAAATQLAWSSGRTPFPIGVGRKGRPLISINSLSTVSALP